MHRFFIPKEQISENKITITGSDVNHIKNVLRLKAGDKIEVFDGFQNTYSCKIIDITPAAVKADILKEEKKDIESNLKITLAQCLAKGKKMDLIIKMATELGVYRIIPIISERSIPKIEEKEEKKIEHWQTIAKEAAEQSGRSVVPEIFPLTKIKDLNPSDRASGRGPKTYDLAIMPWEGETKQSLKSALTTYHPNSLIILIGPEGGFSHTEAEKAKEAGFNLVSLGKRILRCETAAVSTLAKIFYELEK
jgi:16S rRNA (uracil1498-N3)-methyltransferase